MTLLPALFGLMAGISLLALISSLWPMEEVPEREAEAAGRARSIVPAVVGAAAAALAYVATGWVVGGLLAGAGAWSVARGRSIEAGRVSSLATTEAVAAWAKMLRSTLAGAAGVTEAIRVTAPVAPIAIRAETTRLAARIGRDRPVPALVDFADALGDPAADTVVSALILATERQARDLGALLDEAAASARAEAAMRKEVQASRARLRTAIRMVNGMTLLIAAYLLLTAREYLEPYDTALGQAVLMLLGGCAAASLVAFHRMARIETPARVLPVPVAMATER